MQEIQQWKVRDNDVFGLLRATRETRQGTKRTPNFSRRKRGTEDRERGVGIKIFPDQLTTKGRAELDRLVATISASSGSKAASIVVVGHTDRLGSYAYNRRLSERRADAVKEYLGPIANAESITAQGLGRSDPVTGTACNSVRDIRKLRDCLQPDRRVEINVVAPGAHGR